MPKKNTDHCVIGKDELHGDFLKCNHCGQTHVYKLPMSVKDWVKMTKRFTALHADCQPSTDEGEGPLARCDVCGAPATSGALDFRQEPGPSGMMTWIPVGKPRRGCAAHPPKPPKILGVLSKKITEDGNPPKEKE